MNRCHGNRVFDGPTLIYCPWPQCHWFVSLTLVSNETDPVIREQEFNLQAQWVREQHLPTHLSYFETTELIPAIARGFADDILSQLERPEFGTGNAPAIVALGAIQAYMISEYE